MQKHRRVMAGSRLKGRGVPRGNTAGSPMITRCVGYVLYPLGASLVRLLVESMVGTLKGINTLFIITRAIHEAFHRFGDEGLI